MSGNSKVCDKEAHIKQHYKECISSYSSFATWTSNLTYMLHLFILILAFAVCFHLCGKSE